MKKASHTHYIYFDGATWLCSGCDVIFTDEELLTALKSMPRISPRIPKFLRMRTMK